MSQISPPIRILLVCTLAFMAAWMLFLRPKDDAGTPAAATPSAQSSRPVEGGGGETAAGPSSTAVAAGNAGEPAVAGAEPGKLTKESAAAAGLPVRVLRA